MDRVLRHAIGLGLDPLIALQMATINTAQNFGVDRDLAAWRRGAMPTWCWWRISMTSPPTP